MGNCVSTPPQPSASTQLFPGVHPTKSTQPSIYVLQPPGRKSVAPQEDQHWKRRTSTEERAIEAARDAGAKATADLAQSQFKATATCAAQASAAAAAISLQIAMMSMESPRLFSDDFYDNISKLQDKDKKKVDFVKEEEDVPSTVVNTETVSAVVKQNATAPPVPPTSIQLLVDEEDDVDTNTLDAIASNVSTDDGPISPLDLSLDSNLKSNNQPMNYMKNTSTNREWNDLSTNDGGNGLVAVSMHKN